MLPSCGACLQFSEAPAACMRQQPPHMTCRRGQRCGDLLPRSADTLCTDHSGSRGAVLCPGPGRLRRVRREWGRHRFCGHLLRGRTGCQRPVLPLAQRGECLNATIQVDMNVLNVVSSWCHLSPVLNSGPCCLSQFEVCCSMTCLRF